MTTLLFKVLVEESGHLPERLFSLGNLTQIVSVGLTFVDMKLGDDTGLPEFPVHTYRIAQEKVARPRRQQRGGNPSMSPLTGESSGSLRS